MLFRLVGIRARSLFSSMFRRGKNQKAGSGTGLKVLAAILGAYCAVVFGGIFFMMFGGLADSFLPDKTWMYFTYAGFLLVALDFVTNIFMTQSQLFDAKDNDLLFSMPLTPGMILGSRLVFLLLYDYVISLLIIIPAMTVYGIYVGYTLTTFFMVFAGFLLLPLFAETLACLIGWLFAMITSGMRHKQIVTTVLSLACFSVYFVFCFNWTNYLQAMVQNAENVVTKVPVLMYPFLRFGEAVAGTGPAGGWLNFLIFALIGAIPFAILIFVLSKCSLRLVTEKPGAARAAGRAVSVSESTAHHSLMGTLIGKEFKRFFTSSSYLLNAGLGFVLLIVASVAAFLERDDILAVASELPGMEHCFLPVFTAVECFMLVMCAVSSCSVSLEGNTLWLLQSLPIDSGKVLTAKAYMSTLLGLPFIAVCGAVLGVCFGGSVLSYVMLFVLPAVFYFFYSLLGVFINLRMPKLEWQDEAMAVKQSMSVVVSMLIGLAALLIPAIGYIPVGMMTGLSPELYLTALSVIYLVIALLFHWSLLHSDKRFARLGS